MVASSLLSLPSVGPACCCPRAAHALLTCCHHPPACPGIGANDVANAFATSVGSRALRIREAVIIAGIFEFSGAVLLGGFVSETIQNDIADISCFVERPAVLMWGMCSVLLCSGLWLFLATYLELPVSNTHATVGGIVGVTLVAHGPECVVWARSSRSFPFVDGVVTIALSWVFSPLLAGTLASAVFYAVRRYILRAELPFYRGLNALPPLVWFCVSLVVLFVVLKDPDSPSAQFGFEPAGEELTYAFLVALGTGAVAGIIAFWLRRRLEER